MLRSAFGRAALLGAATLGLFVHLQRAPATSTEQPPAPTVTPREAATHEVARAFALPTARTQIAVPEQNPLELYPSNHKAGSSPLVLALHGRDMDPLDMCEEWSQEGRALGWLACPAGNKEANDTFDWGGSADDRLAALDAQLAAVDAVIGPHDHRGDVLVGFSRGAFLARDLVEARPGRFRAMIVLGAAVKLDPARLRAAGIERVLLGCGDKDEARPSMTRTAARLAASGVATRFVSLGPIYHRLPDDLAPVMRDALAWATA